jgi:hypothetical protein
LVGKSELNERRASFVSFVWDCDEWESVDPGSNAGIVWKRREDCIDLISNAVLEREGGDVQHKLDILGNMSCREHFSRAAVEQAASEPSEALELQKGESKVVGRNPEP